MLATRRLAVQMEGGTFRIPSDMVVPEDETWAFAPGDNVACEERAFQSGARRLVAIGRLRALDNKPLQRMNACAARSSAGRAATPRAGARGSSRPWYDRASVRRSPLNGRSLDRQAMVSDFKWAKMVVACLRQLRESKECRVPFVDHAVVRPLTEAQTASAFGSSASTSY